MYKIIQSDVERTLGFEEAKRELKEMGNIRCYGKLIFKTMDIIGKVVCAYNLGMAGIQLSAYGNLEQSPLCQKRRKRGLDRMSIFTS